MTYVLTVVNNAGSVPTRSGSNFCGVVPIREILNKMLEHHAHQ